LHSEDFSHLLMNRIFVILFMVTLSFSTLAQSSYSPSESLQMIQINGFRYPAPSFYNMIWLTMVPEASFVNEVQLFDFTSLETYETKCVYFSSENQLPHAKYIIQKCNGGEINLFWTMDEARIDRVSFADKLQKELRSYPLIQENAETVIYKIKYSRQYVFIKIIRKSNGEEIISVRNSKDPQ